ELEMDMRGTGDIVAKHGVQVDVGEFKSSISSYSTVVEQLSMNATPQQWSSCR
ncbi:hypothetical protein HDV05_006775, partial [Chytridiales sp. JEL 0842]